MEAMKELGERIKTERIAQGYSVKTAAGKAGIARDTWRKIEAGGSAQDTKRHKAMQLLGISDQNAEWGTVGRLEDHAADPAEMIDLNLMFSQAVRFAATVGMVVPEVRDEAERVTIALSELFAHGLELWDRVSPLDREDGGDGHDDEHQPGSAAPTSDASMITVEDDDEGFGKGRRRPGQPHAG